MNRCREIKIGDKASMKRVATDELIRNLAEVSGDKNLMHIDDAYAAKTVFGRRIAHGLFCLGMISNLLGTQLPGEGTVLISENIKYRLPVYIGDEIEATVEVAGLIPEKNKVSLTFACINQNGAVVLDGNTVVKVM